jgi:hypothetical protein
MPAPEAVAHDFQRRQKSVILALIAAVLSLWRRLDRERLTESWQAGVGRSIVDAMARTQLEAAAMVPAYLRDLAAAQGVTPAGLQVVPEALSGVASDGRPLESLMYQPIIAFKRLLADGVDPNEAMRRATAGIAMIAATQAADAGRGAVNVGMTANRAWVSYVRVVNLPACSRCIILARAASTRIRQAFSGTRTASLRVRRFQDPEPERPRGGGTRGNLSSFALPVDKSCPLPEITRY